MDEDAAKRITELQKELQQGQISRRDFLRWAALLGLSLTAADTLAACSSKPTITPRPTSTLYNPGANVVPPQLLKAAETNAAAFATQSAATTPEALSEAEAGTAVPRATSVPAEKIEWFCTACGQHFANADRLTRHFLEEHAKRLPVTRRVERPTYEQYIAGKIERFNERNTVFNRTTWDTALQAQVKVAMSKVSPKRLADIEGQALAAGAIFVDDVAGSFHPAYYGYNGYVRGFDGLYNHEYPAGSKKLAVPDPLEMTARIKQVARFYGADLVGITQVNQNWIYSHYYEMVTMENGPLVMPHKYAIVMGIEMSWDEINTTPGYGASAATALAYSRMAELSASLAAYIRGLGYPALSCGNDTGQSIPLAIDAGLGELGRNGLLLTPEYGPRQRLCKVFTDLPLTPDQPIDFGIQKYCETCFACSKSCPAKAIRKEERTTEITSISNRKGLLRWPVNVSNCFLFWRENGVDCSNCVAACPWAMPGPRDYLET